MTVNHFFFITRAPDNQITFRLSQQVSSARESASLFSNRIWFVLSFAFWDQYDLL
jgi:hypothetical protein